MASGAAFQVSVAGHERYEVRLPARFATSTILGDIEPSPIIVGAGVSRSFGPYRFGDHSRLWRQLPPSLSAPDLAAWQSKWGPIMKGRAGARMNVPDAVALFGRLKALAARVEDLDRAGYLECLGNWAVLRCSARFDTKLGLRFEADSLAHFLVLAMWAEFGADDDGNDVPAAPARLALRLCRHCGSPLIIGERLPGRARAVRQDAEFCVGTSCKTLWHRAREKK